MDSFWGCCSFIHIHVCIFFDYLFTCIFILWQLNVHFHTSENTRTIKFNNKICWVFFPISSWHCLILLFKRFLAWRLSVCLRVTTETTMDGYSYTLPLLRREMHLTTTINLGGKRYRNNELKIDTMQSQLTRLLKINLIKM